MWYFSNIIEIKPQDNKMKKTIQNDFEYWMNDEREKKKCLSSKYCASNGT